MEVLRIMPQIWFRLAIFLVMSAFSTGTLTSAQETLPASGATPIPPAATEPPPAGGNNLLESENPKPGQSAKQRKKRLKAKKEKSRHRKHASAFDSEAIRSAAQTGTSIPHEGG